MVHGALLLRNMQQYMAKISLSTTATMVHTRRGRGPRAGADSTKENPMAKIDFGGVKEDVVTRDEFPLEKARQVLKNETIAVIGYGVQGPAQALNMRDNGFTRHHRVRPRSSSASGTRRSRTAGCRGRPSSRSRRPRARPRSSSTSCRDAAQKAVWPKLKPCLKEGDGAVLLPRVLHRLQGADRGRAAEQHRRHPRGPQGLGRERARELPGEERHQLQLRRVPGLHRARQGADPRPRHRHRLGVPVPDHLRAGGLQRPHRRARHPDGRPGRRDGGAVRRAARATATPPARPSTRPSRS